MVKSFIVGRYYKLDVLNLSKEERSFIEDRMALHNWLDGKPRKCLRINNDMNEKFPICIFENIPHGGWRYREFLTNNMVEILPYVQEEMEL